MHTGIQIQNNLIKRILLIYIFNYLLPLLFIVIKEPKKSVRSKFKIEQKNNQKKEKKEKIVTKKKLQRQKNKSNKV